MGELKNISEGLKKSIVTLILWIILYIIVTAFVSTFIPSYLPEAKKPIEAYSAYINIGLSLIFGYMIIKAFSDIAYLSLRVKYPHSTASAVKNLFQILGIGVLISAIAGASAGGAAGVALGGFIGMIIGYASQHVLGQAIAGLFLLIIRPVKVGDNVTIAGETGIVEEITTLYTYIKKEDNDIVLIPNNMLIGQKIYLLKKEEQKNHK